MHVDIDSTLISGWPNLAHIGFAVPNMGRAIKSWSNGGAVTIVEPQLDPIQNVNCALIVFAETAPIELVAPMPNGANPLENRLRKGGGLDHLCIYTDDMSKDIEAYQNGGALLTVAPVYGSVFDRNICFLQLRTGLKLELMDRIAVGRLTSDPLLALQLTKPNSRR